MQLETLAKTLGLDKSIADFMHQNGFDEAERSFVTPPPGLTDNVLHERLALLKAPFDSAPLLAAASRARSSEALQHVFHYLSFYWWKKETADLYFYRLPMFTQLMGEEDGALLDLALVLEAIPCIRAKFAEMNIPEEYALAALERINRTVADFVHLGNGRLGYPETQHHWMRHFINGELFRIGRFEYLIKEPPVVFPIELGPIFFRRKSDGLIVGLCRDGWKLNADGLQLWKNDPQERAVVTAHIDVGAGFVRGIPVNPAGFAEVNRQVTLSMDEFELVWQKGDFVPDIHIPGGGGMTLELCRQSLIEAVVFFRRYFHQEVKGFTSFSWIYNPDFEKLLPQSNLANFMRELYLSPVSSDGMDGIFFVFRKKTADWSSFPRATSLQRAFHQLHESGRRLKEGGMFIENRGLENFGNATYRSDYKNWLQ